MPNKKFIILILLIGFFVLTPITAFAKTESLEKDTAKMMNEKKKVKKAKKVKNVNLDVQEKIDEE